MGNAAGKVHNDTQGTVTIYVFNYADALRYTPAQTWKLSPGQTADVEAAPHGSGLIVATDLKNNGSHYALGNGQTVKVSTMLRDGDSNPFYTAANVSLGVGLAAGAAVTGGALGAAAGGALAGTLGVTTAAATAAGSAAGMAGAGTAVGMGMSQLSGNANRSYRQDVKNGRGLIKGQRKTTQQWNGRKHVPYTWEYNGREWLYWNGKSWARSSHK